MVAFLVLATVAHADPRITNIGWRYTSVYAVEGDGGVVLVDAHNPGNEDRIVRRLEKAGIDPDRVTLLVVSHGHPDHAGSTAALAELLAVPIAGGAADQPYLTRGEAPLHPTGSRGSLASVMVRKQFPPVVLDLPVDDRMDLASFGVVGELRVVGGHTPGSLVVDLPDGHVISGDLVRSRLFRLHVPTLHFFHDDEARAHQILADLVSNGATTLHPSHGGALPATDVADWLERTGRAEPSTAVAQP